jgi:hypothetical protein
MESGPGSESDRAFRLVHELLTSGSTGRNMNDTATIQTEAAIATLKNAVREARIEAAERSAVIVDLRDAEAARLEMLNEALNPLFNQIPPQHAELFERGMSAGETPRLWLDAVTHVAMGRDKRIYRLLNDTAYGRRVLAESTELDALVTAVTRYVANRIVAREQALATSVIVDPQAFPDLQRTRRSQAGGWLQTFLVGFLLGMLTLFFIALLFTPR